MNAVLWLVAGTAIAWIAFSAMNINQSRGLLTALVIGALSAYFGGSVVVPLVAPHSIEGSDFNALALLIACVSAAVGLLISNLVYDRYGI